MRTIHLDLQSGAAGDMLASALLELYGDREGFVRYMNSLGIPGVSVSVEDITRCGVRGSHLTVLVRGEDEHDEHHHHHHGTHDIGHVISDLPVSEKVRGDVRAVYDLIAGAESAVHGVPVDEVHRHEVGAMDAVADVTAVCTLMEWLSPGRVTASAVNVGGGTVRCAHGLLPVPAPATAKLLEGLPIYEGEVKKELCTPTGAALLRYFVDSFGPMPPLRPERTGFGMGSRDFGGINALRAFLGDDGAQGGGEPLRELCANIDDMTAEAVGFAMERLFESGALDVWTAPIGMKKSRSAVMLSCLCRESEAPAVTAAFFRHTTTLGIRQYSPARLTLPREERVAEGGVRIKRAFLPDGTAREKAEYEDLARIARERDITLAEAAKIVGKS